MFIRLLWFCHGLPKGELVRTYVNHVRNICHLELANSLTKRTLLVIWQIQDVFNTLRNKSSSPSVKAMQIYPRIKLRSAIFQSSIANLTDCIYRGLKGLFSPMLHRCSIDNLSIKIYENLFSRSDSTYIRVYLFRLSFLTILHIYKDYFKGRHS